MVRVRFKPLRINKRRWRQPWIQSNADPEKSPLYGADEEDQDDYDYYSSTNSSRTSSNSYDSGDAMLSRDRKIRDKTAEAYHEPQRRFNRIFTLALVAILGGFLLLLYHMHSSSIRQVRDHKWKDEDRPQAWQEFAFLQRYYGGIRSLVARDDNQPEFPADTDEILRGLMSSGTSAENDESIQRRESAEGAFPYVSVNPPLMANSPARCFLDEDSQVQAPSLKAFEGVVQGFPDEAIGLRSIFESTANNCLDRFGRLGAYGFGYSQRSGGTGAGMEGDRTLIESIWTQEGEIDYNNINWTDAKQRCSDMSTPSSETGKSVVLIRTWSDYHYDQEDIMHLRALVSELDIQSGGAISVHFLIHVRDENLQIWSDDETHQRVLDESLPRELKGMGSLWSETQMALMYAGLGEPDQSNDPMHSNARSTFMPVQHFAQKHPEIDFFWNFEMDVRYTGHFLHLVQNSAEWARKQPRKGLWERNARFYIPAEHGSWEDFVQMVRVETDHGPKHADNVWHKLGIHVEDPNVAPSTGGPVWGALAPAWDETDADEDVHPPGPYDKDKYTWGVGEDADLITFSPMFDPMSTGWPLTDDMSGYNTSKWEIPRRASLGTMTRLSRKLLETMHRDTALKRRTMASEMWPTTCALHHGLKAVYVPHPIYVDRKWPTDYLAAVLNSGPYRKSGGSRASVFSADRLHNLQGLSWSPNSEFGARLWRRWLGYKVDGVGGEEEELSNEGRMCLPPMLLHPVKQTDLIYEHRD